MRPHASSKIQILEIVCLLSFMMLASHQNHLLPFHSSDFRLIFLVIIGLPYSFTYRE